MGCDPSLSSIPVRDQRSFADALAEVAAWLAAPGRGREVLLVYLDDQPDLLGWVRTPRTSCAKKCIRISELPVHCLQVWSGCCWAWGCTKLSPWPRN